MNIIEMAHKAGLWYSESTFVWTSPTEGNQYPEGIHQEALERFAALVAAAERLSVTEAIKEEMTDELEDEAYHLCMELIAKILKRGQT
jgi:hypothetical protein